MNDVSILGLGASGDAAARLALNKGAQVYVSDTRSDAATSARGADLRTRGARVDLGRHDVERVAASDTVVVSPGIPPDAPVLRALRARGVHWISELELAFRFLQGPLIAVTGTNGKTTTCALAAHLLEEGGLTVGLGGNIGAGLGPAASELALRDPAPAWFVLEVSSFQLADVETFRADVGVVTNLAPDHLDRYPDVDAYWADKARLFDNADAGSRWVLNADDPAVLELAADAPGERRYFSVERTDVEGAVLDDGVLRLTGTAAGGAAAGPAAPGTLLHRDELPLLGVHNVANALAASLAAGWAGVGASGLRRGLASAEPLPHRLQPVAEIDGVLWINDSKATNVAAAVGAVRSLEERPLVALVGGKDKGEDFGPLGRALEGRARAVLAYGAAAGRLVDELGGAVPVRSVAGAFEAVVRAAAVAARPGDVVLLAPACSSFDMFDSYEARGRRFSELVGELADASGGSG